jgi:hypothetical protein
MDGFAQLPEPMTYKIGVPIRADMSCTIFSKRACSRASSRRLPLNSTAEVASLLEAGAIADRRYRRARDDRADARHGHQALAAVILLRQRFDLGTLSGHGFHPLKTQLTLSNH